ncbi:Dolichyl-diphosphooligosaccharide--protein glycosyltransferase 67 kDasubunit [Zea mays]|uniref:Dolichyl-diphosphooligosaccharide--protein glycosyltransferase 67 kDasubunit n=1 Tax=Zea mays TaxID=4577 RepID=A0A1D6JMF1_MAIZE|nr:Dolichyl-diphosphooligosaccharide--protein glycosyltransferase 67 kDasubunit [Zea mays]
MFGLSFEKLALSYCSTSVILVLWQLPVIFCSANVFLAILLFVVQVQATVQKIQGIFEQCLAVHDKLEASLRDLSRTGDIQSCKAARKAADTQFKELSKDLKPLLATLQSSPQSYQILPKVEDLIVKEREMQEKLMTRHSTVVDSFEKKLRGQDVENRIALQQQKIAALRQEVESLLEYISEI